MLNRATQVAAVMIVRNEEHIIGSCIGHLLNTVGVDRVYVVDNGSTDRTPEILGRIARVTGRVVVEADAGAYRQNEIITALAHRASADGAAWVLPTDADEFLWLRPGVSLEDLVRHPDIGGYRLEVRNFVQAQVVRRDWPGSITTMCVVALPAGSSGEGRARVSSGDLPFLRITYPTKVLLRTNPSLCISFGNHDASGTAGPLVPLIDGEILHAPMRSFERLHQRAEAGRRTQVVTPEPDQNWHLKRVAAMDEAALAEEWRKNSYRLLSPVRKGATRLDLRLSRVGLQQAKFRRSLARG